MKRTLDVLKILALVCVCLLCSTLAWEVRSLSTGLQETIAGVNARKTGTVALLNDDLRNLRLTLDNANKAAIDERLFLEKTQPDTVKRMNRILDSTNALVKGTSVHEKELAGRASKAIDAGTASIQGLQPVESSLRASLDSVNVSVRHIDALVNDPDNAKTLHNVQEGTRALAGAAQDGQAWVHSALHPSWPKRVLNAVLIGVKIFNPF